MVGRGGEGRGVEEIRNKTKTVNFIKLPFSQFHPHLQFYAVHVTVGKRKCCSPCSELLVVSRSTSLLKEAAAIVSLPFFFVLSRRLCSPSGPSIQMWASVSTEDEGE